MDIQQAKQTEHKGRAHGILALGLTNCLLLVMVVVVTGVAIYGHYFYQGAIDPAYAARIASAAGERVARHAPTLQTEALQLGIDTWPLVELALIEQARQDYPRLAAALEDEGSLYLNNAETAFLNKIRARYHDYLIQHRQILASEFPEHATSRNVRRVLAAFEATFTELVERYYLDQFRQEAARTESLWKSIPPARQPDFDEPSLEEQLALTAQEWMLAISRPAPEPAIHSHP